MDFHFKANPPTITTEGMKCLGAPIGADPFMRKFVQMAVDKAALKISAVVNIGRKDPQVGLRMLGVNIIPAMNYLSRCVPFANLEEAAVRFDNLVDDARWSILNPEDNSDREMTHTDGLLARRQQAKHIAALPMAFGGMGQPFLLNTAPGAFLDGVASSRRDPDARKFMHALEPDIKYAHDSVSTRLLLPDESVAQCRARIDLDQQNCLHRAFPANHRLWFEGDHFLEELFGNTEVNDDTPISMRGLKTQQTINRAVQKVQHKVVLQWIKTTGESGPQAANPHRNNETDSTLTNGDRIHLMSCLMKGQVNRIFCFKLNDRKLEIALNVFRRLARWVLNLPQMLVSTHVVFDEARDLYLNECVNLSLDGVATAASVWRAPTDALCSTRRSSTTPRAT